ncbi:hypothetical protein [Paenibacillus physcomitrellae]|uniref:Uncharacterized protein n=1 Tax=Paenibacillus physcomitrellae TaxID=1619311 RepID=A0ABQ1FXV6_9BACL|nr:hypothetical protein [Paenibacillus physcomitrellae]GGA32644.1 hypothetical protein GCM10010917_17200 [Paenibacillus physcomitrellae]
MDKPLHLDQQSLVQAWQQQLPEMIGPGDSTMVQADNANPQAINVHINAAGHQKYGFDFRCTYKDTRELDVALVDVDMAGRSIDEHSATVQELVDDYMRHIHECAQVLHHITDPS